MATKAVSAAIIDVGDQIKNDLGTVTVAHKIRKPAPEWEADQWRFYFEETVETRVYDVNNYLHLLIGSTKPGRIIRFYTPARLTASPRL